MFNQFVIDHVNAHTPGQYFLAGAITALLAISIVSSVYSIVAAATLLHKLNQNDRAYRTRRGLPPLPTFRQVMVSDAQAVAALFVGAFLWVVIGPDAVDGRLDSVKRFGLKAAALTTAIVTRLFAVALLAGIAHHVGGHK